MKMNPLAYKRMVGIAEELEIVEPVKESGKLSEFREHLAGKHDQLSHGRRGAAGQTVSARPYNANDRYPEGAPPTWVANNIRIPATVAEKSTWGDGTGPSERAVRRAGEEFKYSEREYAVLWDKDGVKISQTRGDLGWVIPPSRAGLAAHTMLHNHPNDSPLSTGDLGWAGEQNLRQLRSVGPNSTYIVRAPKGAGPEDWQDIMRDYALQSTLVRMEFGGRKRKESEGWLALDGALRESCKRHGFKLTIRHRKGWPQEVQALPSPTPGLSRRVIRDSDTGKIVAELEPLTAKGG